MLTQLEGEIAFFNVYIINVKLVKWVQLTSSEI